MTAIIIRPSETKVFQRGCRAEGSYHLPYALRYKRTYLDKEPANRRQLIRTWQVLHHNACHSVIAVEKKWRAAYQRFEDHHMGSRGLGRSTTRFLNEYTAHRWM